MISSTFRSVPYPRFVFVGYAAIPPSAAPVRFPLESTPPLSRKGIAEDSAPFSPGRRFGFQRAVVNLPKTSVRKPSLCTLTAARKSCIMYPEYWRTIQAPSIPSRLNIGGESVGITPAPAEGGSSHLPKPPSHRGSCFGVPPL